jgi:Reverse transcriptase (RNA-dependent DNA polymerase)
MARGVDLKRVGKSVVKDTAMIPADHCPIVTRLKIIARMRKKKSTSKGLKFTPRNWSSLLEDEAKSLLYNVYLREKIKTVDMKSADTVSHLLEAVKSAISESVPAAIKKSSPWFSLSEQVLLPLLDARNTAYKIWVKTKTTDAKENFREARRKVKHGILDAKNLWLDKELKFVKNMNNDPASAWAAMYKIVGGFTGHWKQPKVMTKMHMLDGSIAETDTQNAEAVREHFETDVFARSSTYDTDALNSLSQRQCVLQLGEPPSFDEFKSAIRRMKSRKAPGENGIPAEAYKLMDDDILLDFHSALVRFWIEDDFDPVDWHTVKLKLLPKKGDLSLAKNWRPISLLDVLSKSLSLIIQTRLDQYLSSGIGLQEQNGFSSNRGCVDGTAALKIALQNLHHAGQETFVLFVDLVKAFDSVNREMLWKVLAKMGVPPTLIKVIEKMYRDVRINCDVNGTLFSFESKSGVKQGDPLAPVLFLFAIQAALESMNKQWPVKKPNFEWCPTGGNLSTRITCKSKLATFELNRSIFADDAAILFCSRDDIVIGSKHVCDHFAKFGLEVHLGSRSEDGKKVISKTEFMHVPAKNQNGRVSLSEEDFDVYNGRFVSSCKTFRYLGTLISNDLDDSGDIDTRIKKASSAFHFMTPVLKNKGIGKKLRAGFFISLVTNNALWGCDSWAMKESHYKQLDMFQNRCIRSMSGMTRYHCQYHHRSMEEMRTALGVTKLSSTVRVRQLHFLEKIARQPLSQLTRQVIGCQASRPSSDFKFSKGSTTTTQSTYRNTLEAAGLCEKGKGGSLGSWMQVLVSADASRIIEENLKLPAGTYARGRKISKRDQQERRT